MLLSLNRDKPHYLMRVLLYFIINLSAFHHPFHPLIYPFIHLFIIPSHPAASQSTNRPFFHPNPPSIYPSNQPKHSPSSFCPLSSLFLFSLPPSLLFHLFFISASQSIYLSVYPSTHPFITTIQN